MSAQVQKRDGSQNCPIQKMRKTIVNPQFPFSDLEIRNHTRFRITQKDK